MTKQGRLERFDGKRVVRRAPMAGGENCDRENNRTVGKLNGVA